MDTKKPTTIPDGLKLALSFYDGAEDTYRRGLDPATVTLDEEDRVELGFMLKSRGPSALKRKLLDALEALEARANVKHPRSAALRAEDE